MWVNVGVFQLLLLLLLLFVCLLTISHFFTRHHTSSCRAAQRTHTHTHTHTHHREREIQFHLVEGTYIHPYTDQSLPENNIFVSIFLKK